MKTEKRKKMMVDVPRTTKMINHLANSRGSNFITFFGPNSIVRARENTAGVSAEFHKRELSGESFSKCLASED